MKQTKTIKMVWFEWRNDHKRVEREIKVGDLNAYYEAQTEANNSQSLDKIWHDKQMLLKYGRALFITHP